MPNISPCNPLFYMEILYRNFEISDVKGLGCKVTRHPLGAKGLDANLLSHLNNNFFFNFHFDTFLKLKRGNKFYNKVE
jgi:hypothetical protein